AAGTGLPTVAPPFDPEAATATGVSIVAGAPGAARGRGKAYLYEGSALDHESAPSPEATMQLADLGEGAGFGSSGAYGPFGASEAKVFVGSPGADRVDRFNGDSHAANVGAHEDTLQGPKGRSFGSTLGGLEPSGNLRGLLFVGAPGDDGSAPLGGFVAVYG